jgi:hypothetical protein
MYCLPPCFQFSKQSSQRDCDIVLWMLIPLNTFIIVILQSGAPSICTNGILTTRTLRFCVNVRLRNRNCSSCIGYRAEKNPGSGTAIIVSVPFGAFLGVVNPQRHRTFVPRFSRHTNGGLRGGSNCEKLSHLPAPV